MENEGLSDLGVLMVQAHTKPELGKAGNLAHLEELISDNWPAGKTIDLVVLPEMFATGFQPQSTTHAEVPNLLITNWLKHQAKRYQCVFTGTAAIKRDDGAVVNRLLWVSADGKVQFYDKAHLFSFANEQHLYTAGKRRPVFQLKGWNVLPLICYDIRFPVWCRNRISSSSQVPEYDLAVVCASWPNSRIEAWDILLPARALENQSYFIAVNRTGDEYSGHSEALSPKGEQLFPISNTEEVFYVSLKKEYLQQVRHRYPFLNDADKFSLLDNA